MESQILVNEICPTKAQAWVKAGALLVDVREKEEVAQLAYDVPHIVHIPLSEFEERYLELPQDKALVMVCKGGTRSLRAAGFLVNHGYTHVVNMKHGLIRWVQKGFATKGDISAVMTVDAAHDCCGTPQTKKGSCCGSSPKSDSAACC